MIAEEEIESAVYCLRREFGDDLDEAMLDRVIADIRRQHRDAMIKSITGFFSRVGNGLSESFRLLAGPLAAVTREPKRT